MRRLAFCLALVPLLALGACGAEEITHPLPETGPDCTSDADCGAYVCADNGLCYGDCGYDAQCSDSFECDSRSNRCVPEDGGNPSLDTGIDTGADAGIGDDTGSDTGTPGECASGVVCQRTNDCAGSGLDFPTCVEGCCVGGTPPETPCAAHLDACSSETQTTTDFFCNLETGQCLTRCDLDSADDTGSEDCPMNSYCLGELEVEDPLEFNGVCLPGDCDSNIFDPASCDGTGTCLPVGNGASYCISGGTGEEGSACNQAVADDGSQPASDICGPGLLCFQSECITPCNLRDGDDGCTDSACIEAFDTTPRNQPGVCGEECEAFSTGACGEGELCSPILGRRGLQTWMCVTADGDELAEGDACGEADTYCVEGTICVDAECLPLCLPAPDSEACAEGELCTPSTIGGLGFCQESCEPWPRRPAEYGCVNGDDTCLPFVFEEDEVAEEIFGVCMDDEGFAAGGEGCSNHGFLGGDCEDFAVCLAMEEGAAAECLPLCEPFNGEDDCGDGTCSGVQPLVGQQNFSFCLPDPQAGAIGDRCTDETLPCAADDSICLDLGAGAVCLAVCREGMTDCDELGGTCETGGLNPDVVPMYMGLCAL